MPNTWILQVNPAELDLAVLLGKIALGQAEREGEWQVQRHARRMRAGDRLLFWQSGPRGGLMAVGELLSGAYRQLEAEGPWLVGYRIESTVEPALSRAELLAERRLRNLSLLRRSQGRDFAVTADQGRCLEKLLRERLRPLAEPPAPHSLPQLLARIRRNGLQLSEDLIRRYHLALQSSGLVILAGASGLGKSWLTRAYADARSAHYLLVPVAPNWLGPEDLLGYLQPVSSRFQPTALTRFVQAAGANWQQAQRQGIAAEAFHLVLDEINLARIEYYFAPFLALLEVRRRGEPAALTLADGSELPLPPNLYCIGTPNMDETTQPLSDKVCDRAQIIELEIDTAAVQARLADKAWGELLIALWEPLTALVPISWRSLDDLESYVRGAEALGLDWRIALDEQLVQKILPRLRPLQLRQTQDLAALATGLPPECRLTRAKLAALSAQLQEQGFAAWL